MNRADRFENVAWMLGFPAFLIGVAGLLVGSTILLVIAAALVVAVIVAALAGDILFNRHGWFAWVELVMLAGVIAGVSALII